MKPTALEPPRTGQATIRIASIPAGHVYVRHLAEPSRPSTVRRLPDIAPEDGVKVPGGWWPPMMLDPDWIRRNRGEFDIFHVHFGFDGKTAAELEEITAALRELECPLVLTAHDLRNPHHPSPEPHLSQLGVLMEAADEVITLTHGAAAEIRDRWGREARVLPHPHVVNESMLGLRRAPRRRFIAGVHAKSLRANMDVLSVCETLAAAVTELPEAYLRIDLHHEVFDPESHWHDPGTGSALRRIAHGNRRVILAEHSYFTDEQLWRYIRSLDLSVLPYRFGTHSGWLEACFDLGTTVAAPTCGYYSEQRPCITYAHDEGTLDADSLVAALGHAYEQRPGWQADPDQRLLERAALARAHEELYRSLLA